MPQFKLNLKVETFPTPVGDVPFYSCGNLGYMPVPTGYILSDLLSTSLAIENNPIAIVNYIYPMFMPILRTGGLNN